MKPAFFPMNDTVATQHSWLQAFNISESQFREWQSHATTRDEFTFWCLAHGKLDTQKYLDWAKNHYGLPVVNSAFFKTKADSALWKKIESVANWSMAMLPIYEWDGVIFVACVEPHTDIQWSFPVRYVLASAEDLKIYWNALQDEPAAVAPKVAPTTAPKAAPITAPKAAPTTAPKAAQPAAKAPAPPQEPAMPSMADLPELPELPENTNPGVVVDTPEGLNLNLEPQIAAAADAPAGIAEPPPPATDAAPDGMAIDFDLSAVDKPTGIFEMPADMGGSGSTSTEDAKAAVDSYLLKIPHHNEHTTEETLQDFKSDPSVTRINVPDGNELQTYFEEMRSDFNGSLVLKLADGAFVPFAWDKFWSPQENPVGPTDVTSPSAFRIVYRTKQPYLGHIVDTPVNRAFFSAWGEKELPKRVLIQPLLHNDKLMGALICRCKEEPKNNQILMSGHTHAQKISEMLKGAAEQKAA